MLRIPHLLILLLIASSSAMLLPGCGAVIVGGAAAGTVAYFQGDLNAVLKGPVSQALRAVDRAIQQTGVEQLSRSEDNLGGHFILLTAQGEKVEITLKKAGKTTTDIIIRVGFFGDESLSHQILEEIQAQMKQ